LKWAKKPELQPQPPPPGTPPNCPPVTNGGGFALCSKGKKVNIRIPYKKKDNTGKVLRAKKTVRCGCGCARAFSMTSIQKVTLTSNPNCPTSPATPSKSPSNAFVMKWMSACGKFLKPSKRRFKVSLKPNGLAARPVPLPKGFKMVNGVVTPTLKLPPKGLSWSGGPPKPTTPCPGTSAISGIMWCNRKRNGKAAGKFDDGSEIRCGCSKAYSQVAKTAGSPFKNCKATGPAGASKQAQTAAHQQKEAAWVKSCFGKSCRRSSSRSMKETPPKLPRGYSWAPMTAAAKPAPESWGPAPYRFKSTQPACQASYHIGVAYCANNAAGTPGKGLTAKLRTATGARPLKLQLGFGCKGAGRVKILMSGGNENTCDCEGHFARWRKKMAHELQRVQKGVALSVMALFKRAMFRSPGLERPAPGMALLAPPLHLKHYKEGCEFTGVIEVRICQRGPKVQIPFRARVGQWEALTAGCGCGDNIATQFVATIAKMPNTLKSTQDKCAKIYLRWNEAVRLSLSPGANTSKMGNLTKPHRKLLEDVNSYHLQKPGISLAKACVQRKSWGAGNCEAIAKMQSDVTAQVNMRNGNEKRSVAKQNTKKTTKAKTTKTLRANKLQSLKAQQALKLANADAQLTTVKLQHAKESHAKKRAWKKLERAIEAKLGGKTRNLIKTIEKQELARARKHKAEKEKMQQEEQQLQTLRSNEQALATKVDLSAKTAQKKLAKYQKHLGLKIQEMRDMKNEAIAKTQKSVNEMRNEKDRHKNTMDELQEKVGQLQETTLAPPVPVTTPVNPGNHLLAQEQRSNAVQERSAKAIELGPYIHEERKMKKILAAPIADRMKA